MKVEKFIYQYRRDFRAIYICEHCGEKVTGYGYDDENFHRNVIPKMVCKKCGKRSPEDYRPLSPKYPEGMQL